MTYFLIATGIGVGCYTAGVVGGKLFDDGLANALCVESLRHGTNLGSYAHIRLWGGDPNWGGSTLGSTYGVYEDPNVIHHFYVFKGTEYPHCQPPQDMNTFMKVAYFFHQWVGPRVHTFLSGYHAINAAFCLHPDSNNLAVKCSRVFFGVLGGLITLIVTPILKFRVSNIDPSRFINDEHYVNMAYMTPSKLEPWRIGILGSLLTGVNSNWLERVKARPLQLAIGILQVVTSLAIFAITIYLALYADYSRALFLAPLAVGFLLA